MSWLIRCRMKPYIQPFERKLALAELASLADSNPELAQEHGANNQEYLVQSKAPAIELADKLAYWETIDHKERLLTDQVLREATVNVVRNGVTVGQVEYSVQLNLQNSIPGRRCLRYGSHGLHEYRGKFFPQLARSLINIARVPTGGIVADPMSGSGTTLVEALLAGCHGIGMDLNPLSVFMARTKCAVSSANPSEIIDTYNRIREHLLVKTNDRARKELTYFSSLPIADQEYLVRWFSPKVLAQLDHIVCAISLHSTGAVRDLLKLSLSNILRGVSWQKAADLRVRKEIKLDAEVDPIGDFMEEMERSVKTVTSCLYQVQHKRLGSFDVRAGDARNLTNIWKTLLNKVDVVITSPPYATALPYLDTDRLSLIYLGLLSRKDMREKDHEMIGNREITERRRDEYWRTFFALKPELPESIVSLIERIHSLNLNSNVGFRRRNLPSLLVKYFLDMKEVLSGIKAILKPGAYAFVVVGDNHTIAGNERVEIATTSLLADVAAVVGLKVGEHIPMEMLVSREIYKKNAVASEMILCLQRPKG